ncbi:Hypothetical protein AJAP_42820 (plasmid) [Amycolatopsis japonica]|uniref:DUF3560 domain-containing protein n=1 Tax=Amycolatopsis japonica TaxID=208439 RepID=A0A075VAG8_9PSEU|nr:DUF3560 domain-containing protein [Amycolatopsis japonica]AIG81331.1 Hypothetical protein AJAP_42820 [Amycolatopsis japonica]
MPASTQNLEPGKVHPGDATALFDLVLTDQADDRGRFGISVQPIALEPVPCSPPPSPLDVDAARNAPAEQPVNEPPAETSAPAEPAAGEPAAELELTAGQAMEQTDIQIEHTPESGTLLFGSVKGDGTWDAMFKAGFRWRGARKNSGLPQGTLYIPQSRDRPAKRYMINGSAKALREAGFSVWVSINDNPRDHEQVVADKRERLEERVDRLEDLTERRLSKADGYRARHDQISERFAFGQPILVGHHSERRARKDQERMHTAMRNESAELDKAERSARAAAVTQANLDREHEHPAKITRKIEKLEADLRDVRRRLDGHTRRHLGADGKTVYYVENHPPATGTHREALLAKIPYLEGELDYDRKRLEAAKASGKFTIVDPDEMKPGRMLAYWGGVGPIVRVNKKSVTVRSQHGWTNTVQLERVRQVRDATPEEAKHWAQVEADHKVRVAADKAKQKEREARWAAGLR